MECWLQLCSGEDESLIGIGSRVNGRRSSGGRGNRSLGGEFGLRGGGQKSGVILQGMGRVKRVVFNYLHSQMLQYKGYFFFNKHNLSAIQTWKINSPVIPANLWGLVPGPAADIKIPMVGPPNPSFHDQGFNQPQIMQYCMYLPKTILA